MVTFDPKNPPGGGGNNNDGVAAGDYLVIIKSFTRRSGQTSRKPYLRTCFQVIHGPAKGRTFFDSLTVDLGNSGAMFRLSMLCEQVNSGSFDLDDDQAVKDALCRKPLKVRVSREVSGQYTNNGISRYLNKEVTDFDRRVMDTWLVDEAEKGQFGGSHGTDADGLPDDGPGYGGGDGGRENDDIPFATSSMSADPSPVARILRRMV
jgi:hypothetical protein